MGQRPLIPQRDSWGRFKQNIAKLTIEALFILREETELARDEPTLNRTLALCFVEANLRLDLDYQPALDAKNFPHSEDEKKSISENNIPDLSWNIIDHVERCNRNFALECKRLGKPSSRTWVLNKQYIEEGLLRFFKDEEGYSKGCELGAMVGYIQNMDFEEILCEVNRHMITFEPSIPTLAAPVEGWQRRLVQPAFHKHRIETYAETMVQLTQEELATWQPYQEINIAQAMQRLTLRIILKALFNLDSPSEAIKLGDVFTTLISSPTRLPTGVLGRFQTKLPFSLYSKGLAAKQALDNFVYNLIAQRRAEGQDVGDVLSMLLQAQDEGNTMTDQQVHDQVLTFIAAGHETAQNTLSWTFYLLSQHP